MTGEILFVYATVLVAIILFITEKVRLDVTALLVILALGLSGVITPKEAVAGFGSTLVVLIAALFVVGEGLYRTGVAGAVGRMIARASGGSETRMIMMLMPTVAFMSAFMSSTGAVAIFIPIVLSMCRDSGLAPSRVLIPLAFGALIGGMLTLIGTPPNIAASEALVTLGRPAFGFFDFTPIGGAILILGLIYLLTVGRWVLPMVKVKAPTTARKTLREPAELFDIDDHLHRLRVAEGSSMIGHTVIDVGLRSQFGITVIAVERRGRLLDSFKPVLGNTRMEIGDMLIILGPVGKTDQACQDLGLIPMGFPEGLQRRFRNEFGAAAPKPRTWISPKPRLKPGICCWSPGPGRRSRTSPNRARTWCCWKCPAKKPIARRPPITHRWRSPLRWACWF